MLKKIAAAVAGILVAVFAVAVLYIYDSGFATVHIRDGQRSFTIPVPMAFAEVGLLVIAGAHPDRSPEILAQCREVLPAVLTELEQTTDATFVDVVSGRDSVKIKKDGSHLIVNIESPDERVRVKAPIRSLTRIFRRLLVVSTEQTLPAALKF